MSDKIEIREPLRELHGSHRDDETLGGMIERLQQLERDYHARGWTKLLLVGERGYDMLYGVRLETDIERDVRIERKRVVRVRRREERRQRFEELRKEFGE